MGKRVLLPSMSWYFTSIHYIAKNLDWPWINNFSISDKGKGIERNVFKQVNMGQTTNKV